ncbi:MAG TPA: SBBP repeat-containing protein [Anaerolineae bacterium]|nr:SBBP repeat-containing protein [Anaerolineae bacterium]
MLRYTCRANGLIDLLVIMGMLLSSVGFSLRPASSQLAILDSPTLVESVARPSQFEPSPTEPSHIAGGKGLPSQSVPPFRSAHVATAQLNGHALFVENVGQFDAAVRFQAQSGQGAVSFAPDAISLTLLEPPVPPNPVEVERRDSFDAIRPVTPRVSVNLRLSFEGANPQPRIQGINRLDTTVSYFIGDDPAKWRTHVPVWSGIRYIDLYPGIDLEITSASGAWAWRLVVRDSAHLGHVGLHLAGADRIALDGDQLQITTAAGQFALPLLEVVGAPMLEAGVSERVRGVQPSIDANQVLMPFASSPGSDLSARDAEHASASTPAQASSAYSILFGGSGDDVGYGIALDPNGNAYITGQTQNGATDVFVAKVDTAGQLVYATFLGGGGDDIGSGIAVDNTGAAYITGQTRSSDFPTQAAYASSLGGNTDAFVTMLNPDGSLNYSTYLGGSDDDAGRSIVVYIQVCFDCLVIPRDRPYTLYPPFVAAGDQVAANAVNSISKVVVTGQTRSSDFPTQSASDSSYNGGLDAFVARLNGATLEQSTYLGGSDDDVGLGVSLTYYGNVYVTGQTSSSDFPTAGALDPSLGGPTDAFVTYVPNTSVPSTFSTFLGGSGADAGHSIAIMAIGGPWGIHVTGQTSSPDFPTTAGALDTSLGGPSDAFVTRIDTGPYTLGYSTYLGGSGADWGNGIATESIASSAPGIAYVTGQTNSPDFPQAGSSTGGSDVFIAKVNPSGSGLTYSAYLGGSGDDAGWGIAAKFGGDTYVTGQTRSSDFPAQPQTLNGGSDAFVTTLAGTPPPCSGLVCLAVTDSGGNPVSALKLNDEGWPMLNAGSAVETIANPLTVTVILQNRSDSVESGLFDFSALSTSGGRFYVYAAERNGQPVSCGDVPSAGFSVSVHRATCNESIAPGDTVEYRWRLWVQPSEATTLEFSAIWQDSSDSSIVQVPLAQIHPVVFLHGILGSMPPTNAVITSWDDADSNNAKLEPFIGSYNPLLENLMKMGYQLNQTLFPVLYDWRQSNQISACWLRDVLRDSVPDSGGVIAPDGQADVIVHSMGGVVLRTYLENMGRERVADDSSACPYNDDVRKAVFIATPHRGFPVTYNTREGLTWGDYLGALWELPWRTDVRRRICALSSEQPTVCGSTDALSSLRSRQFPMNLFRNRGGAG